MKRFFWAGLMALIFSPAAARAEGRAFAFIYEATPSEPGSVEMENFVTFKTGRDGQRFSQVDFRHEFEFGVTKQLQLSVYVADWNYHSGLPDRSDGFAYSATAVEAIYNFTNPATDALGFSLYEEIKGGDALFESESKIILQKNFGRLIAAYNATLEATWEGSAFRQQRGELQQTFGLSYELTHSLSIGMEMLHEVVFPDWGTDEVAQNFFVGPNVSVRAGEWFATVTALAQATHTTAEPDVQVRTVFGFEF